MTNTSTNKIARYEDLVPLYEKLNLETIDTALSYCEMRRLDIESDRKEIRKQAIDYIKWVGSLFMILISSVNWVWQHNYYSLCAGAIIVLTLLGISLLETSKVLELKPFLRAGTSPVFWNQSSVLAGAEKALTFAKANIFIEYYLPSIEICEKSYSEMCDKFSSAQAYLRIVPYIAMLAVILQAFIYSAHIAS